jgi:hypothetical protein
MNLASPYHDPEGVYNAALSRHLGRLQTAFSTICLGATPPTLARNSSYVAELRAAGCYIAENDPQTSIGDHSRSALRLAVQHARDSQPIAFLFLDRFLFALETEHKEQFLADLDRYRGHRCMVFERSPSAWATHPANYKEVEGMTSRLGELLFGSYVDWCPTALIFDAPVAQYIARGSRQPAYAVWAEWLLLASEQGETIATTEVDWLGWETPFWEGVDAEAMKHAQERDPLEIVKRIQMHAPIALLMAEPRFREISVRTEPADAARFGDR